MNRKIHRHPHSWFNVPYRRSLCPIYTFNVYMSKNNQIQSCAYETFTPTYCMHTPRVQLSDAACMQIILLQPPQSNGKNAAASSSSPVGGNLPSRITDNKLHCYSFTEFQHTYEETHVTQTKKIL